MRRTPIVAALLLALAVSVLPVSAVAQPGTTALAPLHEAGEALEGSYLVVLHAGEDAAGVAQQLAVEPAEVYARALTGFAAELDAAALDEVRAHPGVAYVEQDGVVRLSQWTQPNPPWNIDRMDQRHLPLDNSYTWRTHARGVHAYVFDTGIEYGHWDFGGRAFFAYDAFGGDGSDCHNHGTYVAGLLGGTNFGVAKSVQLWSMRVLNCHGAGSISGIVAAIDWLVDNHHKPAVANFSLGGSHSTAFNSAVDELSDAGVFVVAAAGGSSADACLFSPVGASGAYGVGATSVTDTVAPFSNHGPCVDIYAPGVFVSGPGLGGGTIQLSGTSASAPHVTGVAALYKAHGDAPSSAVAQFLTLTGTPGILSGVPTGSPDLLVHKVPML